MMSGRIMAAGCPRSRYAAAGPAIAKPASVHHTQTRAPRTTALTTANASGTAENGGPVVTAMAGAHSAATTATVIPGWLRAASRTNDAAKASRAKPRAMGSWDASRAAMISPGTWSRAATMTANQRAPGGRLRPDQGGRGHEPASAAPRFIQGGPVIG